MDSEIRFSDRGKNRVIALAGEYDIANSDAIETAIVDAAGSHAIVIVDLSNADYIDSSVLNILVRQWKLLGPSLRIVVPKDAKIRRIFEITELNDRLNVVETVAQAAG